MNIQMNKMGTGKPELDPNLDTILSLQENKFIFWL